MVNHPPYSLYFERRPFSEKISVPLHLQYRLILILNLPRYLTLLFELRQAVTPYVRCTKCFAGRLSEDCLNVKFGNFLNFPIKEQC